jgi:CPA1 family monovalent cation:H+ antiporter
VTGIDSAEAAARIFVALIGAAAVVALIARRTAFPYTIGLVVLGLVIALAGPPIDLELTPGLVLLILIPGLVFEAAYRIEIRQLTPVLGATFLLAGPGVVIGALVTAVVLHLATGLAFSHAFLVGAMVSATDPAAVVATFKRLRSPRRLSTLVEAESLFNDGTGVVLFGLAVEGLRRNVTLDAAAIDFLVTVVASTVLGIVTGALVARLVARVGDHLIEMTFSLVLAYGTYLVAEGFQQSGIIATVAAGITLGNYGRRVGLAETSLVALDTVWEFLAFLLNALTFLLVGFAISLDGLVAAAEPIAWGVVAILVARAAFVYLGLRTWSSVGARVRLGTALPSNWLHVVFWSGLRGAIAVALALSLPTDLAERELLQDITFGIVLFTLLAHGTTAELFLERARVRDHDAPGDPGKPDWPFV